MILVEKFTHNPLGFTPQWDDTIPQWDKYRNAENPHTLHEPMKVRGEDNHAPTMPYIMVYWDKHNFLGFFALSLYYGYVKFNI